MVTAQLSPGVSHDHMVGGYRGKLKFYFKEITLSSDFALSILTPR
jgi:hypothetical protein